MHIFTHIERAFYVPLKLFFLNKKDDIKKLVRKIKITKIM